MTALARKRGVRVERPERPRPRPARPIAAVLLENALEGCVNETWSALLAWHQAAHASDPVVRTVMRRIARDETAHAALAWRIAAWGEARLEGAERAGIERARSVAFDRLEAALAVEEPSPALGRSVGLPRARVASAMSRALRGALVPDRRRG